MLDFSRLKKKGVMFMKKLKSILDNLIIIIVLLLILKVIIIIFR